MKINTQMLWADIIASLEVLGGFSKKILLSSWRFCILLFRRLRWPHPAKIENLPNKRSITKEARNSFAEMTLNLYPSKNDEFLCHPGSPLSSWIDHFFDMPYLLFSICVPPLTPLAEFASLHPHLDLIYQILGDQSINK